MTQADGHVEPIPGAPRQEPQPRPSPQTTPWPQQVDPAAGQPAGQPAGPPAWRPELPAEFGDGPHRRLDPPPLVTTAAVLALVVGSGLLVLALSALDGTPNPYLSLTRLVFPAILVAGGVQALRGHRGALTTGAVFLLLTGVVLLVQALGSELFDPLTASVEVTIRLAAGVLILVFSRVPDSRTFFETTQELRYGRKDPDFFR